MVIIALAITKCYFIWNDYKMNKILKVLIIAIVISCIFPTPASADIGIHGFSDESVAVIEAELDLVAKKLMEQCTFSGCERYTEETILYAVYGDLDIELINPDEKFSSCWLSMRCYGNLDYTLPRYRGLMVHELGHRLMSDTNWPANQYAFSLGYCENNTYIHVSGYLPNIPEKKYLRTSLGYIQPGQPYEQHGPSWGDVDGFLYDEDYADMFMGWVMGYFSDDIAGNLRYDYMSEYVTMVLRDKLFIAREIEIFNNKTLFYLE